MRALSQHQRRRNIPRRFDQQRDYSDARIIVRVTEAERRDWTAAAESRGLTVAELVRGAVKEVLSRTHAVDPRRTHVAAVKGPVRP